MCAVSAQLQCGADRANFRVRTARNAAGDPGGVPGSTGVFGQGNHCREECFEANCLASGAEEPTDRACMRQQDFSYSFCAHTPPTSR